MKIERRIAWVSLLLAFGAGALIQWPAPADEAAPVPPAGQTASAAGTNLSWPEERVDTWRGFTRHVFKVDGCTAWVVEPRQAAPGNPWTWCMEFPDAFTDRTGVPRLLEKGFFHLHIQVGNTFGCPAALKKFDAFYRAIAEKGLAKKGTLIGISRGGLYAYNWAAQNPDKVVCIYGDAPVCDFKSWPGGKGSGKGSPGDWRALIKCYGFKDEAEAMAWPGNPVDNLTPLAKAKIPLIHVVGDTDEVVPPKENTAMVEQRYRELGGEIKVLHKPGVGHHPHGLDDPQPVVDFVLACGGIATAKPELAVVKVKADAPTYLYGGQASSVEPPPRFTGKELGDDVSQRMENGGAVTINLGVYQDGSVDPNAVQVLKEVRQHIRKMSDSKGT